MQQDLYYRHSGKFPIAAVPFGLLMGSVLGGVLAIGYAYATLYCPIVYLNVLLALIFGCCVGGGVAWSLAWLNVRNRAVMHFVNLLAVAVSLYVAWGTWVCGVLSKVGLPADRGLFWWLSHPRAVREAVLILNEIGTWSLGRRSADSGPVNGTFLWVVWAAEAILILGGAVIVVKGVLAVPFCETCQKWCRKRPVAGSITDGDLNQFRQSLEAKDFGCLSSLGPAPEGASAYFSFELYGCPDCADLCTLSVKRTTVSRDKKGKEKKEEKTVIDRLLLTGQEADELQKTLEGLTGTPTPAA